MTEVADVAAPVLPETEWRRLNARMLLVHPVVEVGKALPAIAGAFLAGHSSGNDNSGSRWSLGIAGVVIVLALLRWFTTRFRITREQIQVRRGLIRRRTMAAPIDRVRTVDVTAHLLHRALGLARVVIRTGTSDRKGRDAIVLDGLPAGAAAALRSELLHRKTPGPAAGPDPTAVAVEAVEVEIARLDRAWVRYAPFTLTGAVTGLALLGVVWRVVNEGHVNLRRLKPYRDVADRLAQWPLAVDILVVFAIVAVFIALASTVGYLLSFWNFRLTRHSGGTLHVTRGLLTSRATSIEQRRLRGAELSEPMLLRSVGGARALVIATGLRVGRGGERGGEILLPPAPRREAVRVASTVIDTARPFQVPLIAHPAAARRRRVTRAVLTLFLAGAAFGLLVLLVGWPLWLLGFSVALALAAVPLGRDRYRALGHTFVDGYLVTGLGSLVRRRCAVVAEGIIGWNLKATFFQRRLGLTTLTATTAAGKQRYALEDLAPDEAIRFADTTVPGLLAEFLGVIDPGVPVLEVGGTHVTAAVVDPAGWTIAEPVRLPLDSNADAPAILATLARAGTAVDGVGGRAWGVAMPDPFDYAAGIGRFHGVGKFEALDGIDVRAALTRGLPRPTRIAFVNDADAFAVGEARHGAGVGHRRCVGLTLGTGVGSGWVVDGRAVSTGPGVPPRGRIHLARAHGQPLEDTMSRRAIRRAYAATGANAAVDVREIAARARDGERAAVDVLRHALRTLGRVIGLRLHEFGAEVLVVGGSMSASWDLFGPWLREGLAGVAIPIAVSADTERAALLGAAEVARSD